MPVEASDDGDITESLKTDSSLVDSDDEKEVGYQKGAYEYENIIEYDGSRTDKDIDYDQYKYAVGMKYDLRTKN